MFARIRDQMGDLLTDEDLKKIVEAAVEKAFFEPRMRKEQYGYGNHQDPPYIVEAVQKLLAVKVEEQVKQYVKDHPEEINKALQDALGKGMIDLMTTYFESRVQWPLQQLGESLRQKGIL